MIFGYILQMSRKPWGAQEDEALRLIHDVRGERKWSRISKIMEEEFKIMKRSGKQCRQRYNHQLAVNIKNNQWTEEETKILLHNQRQMGNKWTVIASFLPGRSDNCVKNQFYSRIRKGIRMINKFIKQKFNKEYKSIKTKEFSKIVEVTDYPFKKDKQLDLTHLQLCRNILDTVISYQLLIKDITVQSHLKITILQPEIKKKNLKSSLMSSLKSSVKSQSEDDDSKSETFEHQSSPKWYNEDSSSQVRRTEFYSSCSFGKNTNSSSKTMKNQHELNLCKSQMISLNDLCSEDEEEDYPQNNQYKSLNIDYNYFSLIQKFEKLNIDPISSVKILTQPINEQACHIKKGQKIEMPNPAQFQQECEMNIWSQQSAEMMIISPKGLTTQQKLEMNNQRDLFYCGEMMDIEQPMKPYNNFNGISAIPKLMRVNKKNFQI